MAQSLSTSSLEKELMICALHRACRQEGDLALDKIKHLLDRAKDQGWLQDVLQSRDPNPSSTLTLLHQAVLGKAPGLLQELMSRGADPDALGRVSVDLSVDEPARELAYRCA